MSNETMSASAFEYCVSYFNTTFEDILKGIIITYSCIIAAKTKIPLNNENAIRDIFLSKEYLKNINFRNSNPPMANYHFDKETAEDKGRADIRILRVNDYIDDDAYYIIECKRLDGKNKLNKEYIFNGIKRFTNEKKYKFHEHTAGMIGFVVSNMDINENVICINNLLQNNFTEINTEKELTEKQITPDFKYSYYSNHKVKNSTKIIYHLMFNFSDNINGNKM